VGERVGDAPGERNARDDAGAPAPPHFRRNFRLAVANGVIYSGADAFLDPNTVLPLFLSRLTSSHALIGLGSSLASVGWFSPQLVMSNVLEGRAYKLPVYRLAAVLRVAALAALAGLIPWLAAHSPAALLVAFFILFGAYALGGGFAGVSFMDVVAKTIPARRRGRLWSLRLGLGGVFAVLMGWIVRRVLATHAFPANFSIIFAGASALVLVSLAAFSFCVEPPDRHVGERPTLEHHVREGFRVLRDDPRFRRLFRVRILFGLCAMSAPFYALYATQKLGFEPRTAGTFLIAQTLGAVFSNVLWGRWSEKRGDVAVLRYASWLALAAPLVALAAGLVAPAVRAASAALAMAPFALLALTFFCVGATTSGVGVGYPNMLLELAPETRRTAYIGFMNSFVAPILIFPTIGGLVVDTAGFIVLFWASAAFAVVARVSVQRLAAKR